MVLGLLAGRPGAGPAGLLTWVAHGLPRHPPRITAVIPTFRREREALTQLRHLLDPALTDVVARVVLVDQGGTLRTAPGMPETAAWAGPRLVLREQGNLGGSGGFARGLLEASAFPDEAVLLLDDDAGIDPEGLRGWPCSPRCVRRPAGPRFGHTAVLDRTADRADRRRRGGAARPLPMGPSDGSAPRSTCPHPVRRDWGFARPVRRPTTSAGGGRCCPSGPCRLGLPAPYFLKWDDAEYGLRARSAGYRIWVVPGTGVWHPTWACKGTAVVVGRASRCTAIGWPPPRPTRPAEVSSIDSLVHQVKHVLSLQYDVTDLWDAGLAEVLAGPGWLSDGWRGTRDRAEGVLPAPADATIAEAIRSAGTNHRPAGVSPVVSGPRRPRSSGSSDRTICATW